MGTIFLVLSFLTLCWRNALAQSNISDTISEDHRNPYFLADTVQLMLSPYNVARNDTVTTVIYPRALESGTYQLLTSMSGFRQQVDDTIRTVGFNVTVRSMNVTQFKLNFTSPFIANVLLAKLSYLCIDNTIKGLQFYLLEYTLGVGEPGIMTPNEVRSGYFYNFTSKISRLMTYSTYTSLTYRIQPFIKGYRICNTVDKQFSIRLEASVINQSFYEVKIRSDSTTAQEVTHVYFTMLVYNNSQLQSQTTLFQNYEKACDQSTFFYNSFSNKINESSFFYGIQGFYFYQAGDIFYDMVQDYTLNKLVGSTVPALRNIHIIMFNVELRVCLNPNYQYYMNWQHRCYSSCPLVRYYQNQTSLKCLVCAFDCYTCVNNTACESCNLTYHHRQPNIVNGVQRCKAAVGYFSRNSQTVAPKCNVNCLECMVIATNCTACSVGNYLSVLNFNGSCFPCISNCDQCQNDFQCVKCAEMYILDDKLSCIPNCTEFCAQCHILSTPLLQSVCDTCNFGFHVNQSNTSQCHTVCGDGIFISPQQQCDDNNTIDGDGCSSSCVQELGYNCYLIQNDSTKPQVCYYEEEIRFQMGKMIKLYKKNVLQFNIKISTLNHAVLKQLVWENIISINLEYLSFKLIEKNQTFDDKDNNQIISLTLTFQVQYTQNIKSSIEIKIDPKSNHIKKQQTTLNQPLRQSRLLQSNSLTKFKTTPQTVQTYLLKSEDGFAIIYESDTKRSLAMALEYSSMGLAVLSFITFLISLSIYGGKIIALQCIFVVNLCYFSLIGFENLQVFSTVEALSGLRIISLNLNPIADYTVSKLWWTGISSKFMNNCMGLIIILIVPFIVFLTSHILWKYTKNSQTVKNCDFLKKYAVGQLLMTFYLVGIYGFTINLALSISTILKNSRSIDSVGIGVGALLFGLGIFTFLFFIKKKATYFWQFSTSFFKGGVSQHYMVLNILIIWLNSILIVALSDIVYSNIVPILFSCVWIGFLIKFKPYRKQEERKRPIAIQVFNILIQSFYLILKIKINSTYTVPMSQLFINIPIFILVILLITISYTLYCLISKVKNAYSDRMEFLQNELLAKEQVKDLKESLGTKKAESLTLQKEIFENLKQQGLNFINNFSMQKKQIDERWQDLENIKIDMQQKQRLNTIKKQLRRSAFLKNTKNIEYFKTIITQKDDQPKQTQQNCETTQNTPKQRPNQSNKETKNDLSCFNCEEKIGNSEMHQNQNQMITIKYESQKFKDEWREFFKAKQLTSEEKEHSLAIYDMI